MKVDKIITIKDVAKESGVAISTVSNVLNNVDIVSPETKEKVLKVVKELNYVPNINAKLLKSNKRNTIGLFLPNIQGNFYTPLMQAVHWQCKAKGYVLNIYVCNEYKSEELFSMIISSGVEGAIVLNEFLSNEYVEYIIKTNKPIVFIDREISSPNVSSVVIDNYEGATIAIEYLLRLGHRRIGYMHGIHNYDDDVRFSAFSQIMDKYSLAIDGNIIIRGYFEEGAAYSEIRAMLSKGVTLPDAIFCANDEMAFGCINALNDMGINVPSDISIIGFDDVVISKYFKPALTTIHSPVSELGSQSVIELIRLITKEEDMHGVIIKLSPTLVVRDSCSIRI